mmetsp:Transcript_34765/g.65450  ORF Transcript_34765/g.65450 Transcript_34765/m.65450 type:complete len:539 (+) Transcript_34765:49-1665(+)
MNSPSTERDVGGSYAMDARALVLAVALLMSAALRVSSTTVEEALATCYSPSCTTCSYGSNCGSLTILGTTLYGTIPANISQNLPNIKELSFRYVGGISGDARLSGTLPTELGLLTALTSLRFQGNPKIIGSLPTELGQITGLTNLDFEDNSLTGTLPAEPNLLASITRLRFKGNKMANNFLGNLLMFSQLESLLISEASVARAALSNTIPVSSSLTHLEMSHSNLYGTIPAALFALTRLETLKLQGNDLSGSVPSAIGDLTSLSTLDLGDPTTSGMLVGLPPDVGLLSNLATLRLGGVDLSAGLPAELGSLSMLRELHLSGSLLPNLPEEFSNLSGLTYLDLSGSLISELPEEFANLSGLTHLSLAHNRLSQFPLNSSSAQLSRMSALVSLYLNDNQMQSPIPTEIGMLRDLSRLDLGNNQLSGTIPSEMADMSSLRFLDFTHNKLTGTIPSIFGLLPLLTSLHLDHNHFCGVSNTLPAAVTSSVNDITFEPGNRFGNECPLSWECCSTLHNIPTFCCLSSKLGLDDDHMWKLCRNSC